MVGPPGLEPETNNVKFPLLQLITTQLLGTSGLVIISLSYSFKYHFDDLYEFICHSNENEEFFMASIRFQIAPDVEFRMDMELEDVSSGSRDYDVQQHKAEVYKEFERRLKNAFPEGIRIDRFEFGLCLENDG
jgi:hypothetical protein